MAIDIDAIKTEFIQIAADKVGEHLSTTGEDEYETPSVIRAKSDGTKPSYPYITLDVLSVDDESGWEVQQGVDDDGAVYTESVQSFLIVYRVYGSKSLAIDAMYIANALRGALKLPSTRNRVRNNLEGSIVQIFGADDQPVELASEFLESASFNLIFNIVDRVKEETGATDSSVIDSISLEPTFDETTLDDNIVVERDEYP